MTYGSSSPVHSGSTIDEKDMLSLATANIVRREFVPVKELLISLTCRETNLRSNNMVTVIVKKIRNFRMSMPPFSARLDEFNEKAKMAMDV